MSPAFLVAAALLAAVPALCAVAEGRAPVSEAEQARWSAVGRLNVAGQGACTATLIAPDLALTAAHCLVIARTGAVARPGRIHFLPGYRLGRYAAHLRGAATAIAGGFLGAQGAARLDRDIAVVRFSRPAPAAVAPMRLAGGAAPGEAVAALSYGRDRPEALSIETGCKVTGRRGPAVLTDCEATPGVSGAPLVRMTPRGPEIVGVVVAGADLRPPRMRGDALAVSAEAARSLTAALREAAR